MDDTELQIFSESLCTPNFQQFVDKVKYTIDKKIFKLLQENSTFSLDRWRLVGGLAKKTSTLLKADADIVVFHNDAQEDRSVILNDFQDILLLNTSLNEEDIIISSNEVMQFELDGIPIDLLVAQNNLGKYSGKDVVEEQRKKSLMKFDSGKDSKVDLSFELSESSVDFMKKQSKLVHDMARLAKYWKQMILFKHHVYGKSMIFELLGTKAALDEQSNNPTKPSMGEAFKKFLKMVRNIQSQVIIFNDYYQTSDIPPVVLAQKQPILMDPVNPYNNLLNTKKKNIEHLFRVFENAAGCVLTMLENGCTDINLIFHPQPLHRTNRQKENWFLPKERSYLISIEDSNTPWIKRDASNTLMPDCIVRDPRAKDQQTDFQTMLLSLAGFIHNSKSSRVSQGAKSMMSDTETKAAVQSFIGKMDGSKKNWCNSNERPEARAVSLVIPIGKSSNDGICKSMCVSFDLDEL